MIINRLGPERLLGFKSVVFLTAVVAAIGLGIATARNGAIAGESRAEDAMMRLAPRPVRNDIVLVALDDTSVKRYGPVKSWPRSVLAGGLKKVEDAGAKWVVMDLALDTRTQTGDTALWRQMANRQNVILGMAYDANRSQTDTPDEIRSLVFLEKYAIADKITFGATTEQFQYPLFEPPVSDFTGSSRGVGVFDRETETDGVLRSARLVYVSKVTYPPASAPIRGKFPQSQLADNAPVALPNLALVTALRDFGVDKDDVQVDTGGALRIAADIGTPVVIPVDDQGRMAIRFYGPQGRWPAYSFADLMDGKVPAAALKGKTILFGATAPGDPATDPIPTPVGTRMPRVEITANAIATILDRSYFSRYPHTILGTMLLVGLVAGLCLMFVSGARAIAVTVLLAAAYAGTAYALYFFGHTMLPILPGLIVIALPCLIGLALYAGPYKPMIIRSSPTYIPPGDVTPA